jgi:hypothetical protein
MDNLTVVCTYQRDRYPSEESGELNTGEIRIVVWDGRGNRILWPAKDQQTYVAAATVKGVIKSPPLSGIESDEIAIMALVRFGGSNGEMHQITGAFPLPKSGNTFKVDVYANIERAEVVVSAPNIDAALPKARAKLKQDAKVIDAMILTSSLTTNLDGGKYKVDLDYYTGKLKFFPKPTLMLGQQ